MESEVKDKVIKAGSAWWGHIATKRFSQGDMFKMMGSFVAGAQAMESSITDKDAEDLIETFTGRRI